MDSIWYETGGVMWGTPGGDFHPGIASSPAFHRSSDSPVGVLRRFQHRLALPGWPTTQPRLPGQVRQRGANLGWDEFYSDDGAFDAALS